MSTIPLMAPADLGNLREIFEVQRARFRTAPHATAAQRRAKLAALEHAIGKRRREIAAALFADLHKAPAESEFTEIIPTLTEVRYARRNVETWMRPEPVPTPRTLLGARCEVRREPKGVVLILAPWNYPLYLSLGPLVAAIAAGNRAIVRPSEKAPHTARVIEAIVRGAFAPEEVAFAGGGIETANALLEFPFDHIFFTGSTRVGKLVMRAAAEHLAGVTLELGGKSPAVVAEDADLGLAAQRIAWGKFMNAGQTCVAPDYVLVPQARERDFIERTGKAMANMFGKNAARRARTANFGRIVDDAAFDRLTAMLDGSIAGGARIDVGGERSRADRYIAPTIVSNLGFDSPLMAEEIFGPILPVLTYRTTGEAWRRSMRARSPSRSTRSGRAPRPMPSSPGRAPAGARSTTSCCSWPIRTFLSAGSAKAALGTTTASSDSARCRTNARCCAAPNAARRLGTTRRTRA